MTLLTFENTVLDAKLTPKLKERLIKKNLDIIILTSLKHAPSNGYTIIKGMNQKYSYLPASGTIYSTLLILQKTGLVTASISECGKKIYSLTEKGRLTLSAIAKIRSSLQALYAEMLGGA